ncbi:MAG: uroporphyrinogen-III C-methyltransferase [Pseudomonadales bacterium]|nr:uroporphyrinogen-III C-methyltransferase [Pseudomonadales bacterium]MBO6596551.1 uroporphyrinogen-III C-methyltransferase [Pseudomonadales bacterium]MBO6823460.1 uroporphyrinogen-III C-methyltransferase [Pseudomonadales bacterium]
MSDDSNLAESDSTPKSSGGMGGGLAIFLALVAIGVASYPAYETYRQLSEPVIEIVDTTSAELDQLRSQVSRLEGSLMSVDSQLAEISARVEAGASSDDLRSEIGRELDDIRSRLGTSAQDWIYAEVEYLVRMANQRVLMERDATSALYLLQSADDIIREAEGLVAHELRESLARDIAALKSVSAPDTQGIYLELSALVGQVDSLKRITPSYALTEAPVEEATVAPGLWNEVLTLFQDIGARLASLVDFRRGTVKVQPILPPKEAYYLRQNLILKLQMAQLALLEGDEAVYRSAIEEASEWISDAFDPADAASIAMQESLVRLSEVNVEIALPDISGSLVAARNRVGSLKGAGVK